MTNDEVMRNALEALHVATAGLEWYRDACPDQVNGSDDEADEQIGGAIAALETAISARPEPQAAVSEEREAFEAHFELQCQRYGYRHLEHSTAAWIAWQARAVLAASRQVPVIPAGAVLERLKYHWQEADPEMPDIPATWEAFPPDVDCETCIPVLVVRADAVKVSPLPVGEPRQEEGERSGSSGVERMEQALRDQEAHFEKVYADGVDLPDGAKHG